MRCWWRWSWRRCRRRRERWRCWRTKCTPHLQLCHHHHPTRSWKHERDVRGQLQAVAHHDMWACGRRHALSAATLHRAISRTGRTRCASEPHLEWRQLALAAVLARIHPHLAHAVAWQQLRRQPRARAAERAHAEVPAVGVVGDAVDACGGGEVVAIEEVGGVHGRSNGAEEHEGWRRGRWLQWRRRRRRWWLQWGR